MNPRPSPRIVGFDLARAVAVFGMVAVNFRLAISPDALEPRWLRLSISLLEGRAAATFVVLAGVGLALMTRTARRSGDIESQRRGRFVILKRALFLFVVGWLYVPIWPADILHFYGVYLAVAALLVFASSTRLVLAAGALIAAFPILLVVFDYERGWDFEALTYDGLYSPAGAVRHLLFNGFHPVVPWAAFVLAGLVIGRLELQQAWVRRRLLLAGVGLVGAAELTSRALIGFGASRLEADEQEILVAFVGTAPMPPSPLYMLAGLGWASVIIALSVAIGERFRDAGWLRPFIATGQLALTLYVAHVVVGLGVLESLGRLEHESLAFAGLAIVTFCVVSVLFASFWRSRYDRGPLEAIMRRLTR